MNVWYRVRDLDAGRAFYTGVLGFEEVFADEDARWARLRRGDMEIALWEAKGDEGGDSWDVSAETSEDEPEAS